MPNDTVRARIDPETKEQAEAVLSAIGLTVSDAFRLMMVRIVQEKKLPFEPWAPNQTTIDAMLAARRGETTKAGSAKTLFKMLDAGN
jgi:DNA-damage-inducible protein J